MEQMGIHCLPGLRLGSPDGQEEVPLATGHLLCWPVPSSFCHDRNVGHLNTGHAKLAGDAAVRLASINLALRTIAIWLHNKRVIVLLVLMVVGHWSLMLRGMLLTAIWVPGVGCQITNINTTILAAVFIYSMCFDFVVMCLSAYKLVPAQRGTKGTHTKLIGMLFTDGLIYFFTACVANLIATTFMMLKLNTVMSVNFNVPAAVASTIMACRVVRRLADFKPSGPELFLSGKNKNAGHSIVFKKNSAVLPRPTPIAPGIHVEMDMVTYPENTDPEGINNEDQI
ncbi:hypothetical protein AZE42_10028 [Rhizopogon vesiculosus]|uniref:Uncharacterized protein n=1 Tax=Rhizopogon vesiculosus TaxID=180088 RepID=A0A1J8PM07_9AGAM|nr:hypothetical protein AZE42_10028 [Rhizopogon vesiculosus]